jgi:DNA-binding PadR family transcriptional regulator
MASPDHKLLTREILLGFWKVHILHHAAEQPVVGQWILTELRRHGYDVSPGTLYPLLKRMERNGWLGCRAEPGAGPRGRRYYHLTARGADVLRSLRDVVVELHHEVVEEAAVYERPGRGAHRGEDAARRTAGRGPTAARRAKARQS